MKRRFTALLTSCCVLVLIAATSCTREYICQCQMVYSGAPGLPVGEVREYPITDSEKNAESKCRASSRIYDVDGIHTEENCDLF